MALVLLVGAGLMLRSLVALWRVNPGYHPEHALTFSLSLPSNTQTTEAETRARLRRFDAAMRAIPGVEAVSVTLGSRPMIHDSGLPFWIEGQPKPANYTDMHQSIFYLVEAGFQPAMGITLERGRFVTPQDNENAATWSTSTMCSRAPTSPTATRSVNTFILPASMSKPRLSALSDTSGSGVRATIRKTPLKRSSTILLCSFLPNS